jgi:hypothetical protein
MQLRILEAHKNALTPFSPFSRALSFYSSSNPIPTDASLEKEEALYAFYRRLLFIIYPISYK